MELHQTRVHVTGVPHAMRHFLGIRVVGSLIGTTVDVDLLALRRRGVVRILVRMAADDRFINVNEAGPYIRMDSILKLKGYQFTFRPEPESFVQESDCMPMVRDFIAKDGAAYRHMQDNSRDEPGSSGATTQDDGGVMGMSVDNSLTTQEGLSQRALLAHILSGVALTPFNPRPKTPRGMEIVQQKLVLEKHLPEKYLA
ncbi:hypothetical protein D1007_28437 [Hordeum vulgare]|nr:hypothetical protein D1007_28437 [Hordeum vulgare]